MSRKFLQCGLKNVASILVRKKTPMNMSLTVYMLWFNFILCLNFISLCFKLINIHYHTPKQRKRKVKPRVKLNHNIYLNIV